MKVLYVLERYPELSQTFVAQEMQALIDLGVEVSAVALQRGDGGEQPAPAEWASELGPITRTRSAASVAVRSPAATTEFLLRESSWPPPSGTRKLRGLARIAPLVPAARRADQIHSHFATEATDMARILSHLSGTPFSFTAHAADAYGPADELRLNLTEATFARACSGHVAERLIEACPERADRVHQIPVAIDFGRFGRRTSYEPDGPIVAVGRLVEKKGFDDLIEAFSAVGDRLGGRELLIVGEGPMRDELERRAAASGATVRLLGARPNEAVAELLQSASAFGLTPRTSSDGDRDGRPAAIAEAMAAELPILSTTQPGIPELVDPASGFLAEPGNPGSIAKCLSDLFTLTPGARREMGRNASQRARSLHSRECVGSALLELLTRSQSDQ